MICDRLGVDPNELTDEVPLFNDGIELDSIDSLEIIAAIDEEFGVDMTGIGKEPFYNVNSLAAYVKKELACRE
ncbi:MAG: phosphopantetheine-binding protein [Firmicutes bacterium]|nr:phosphopantetheine-binding protein [Bacillota bacterium]